MKKAKTEIINHLHFHEKYLELVRKRQKTSTVRLGYVLPNAIQLPLVFGDLTLPEKAQIEKLDFTKSFADLNEADALTDGFESLETLRADLKVFYPDITADDRCTIIYFKLLPA
ncbi:ASCH domain-containing protein [Pontibacter kalidii]|uniref:ASCH domain-containing protein n=1 Tax=Pontibacter kalidii TaxID=2592049 RepID=UPI002250237D|nr:ASCH domain-containing protein [Pontibacter kalidii]